jgi:hypothetical protein
MLVQRAWTAAGSLRRCVRTLSDPGVTTNSEWQFSEKNCPSDALLSRRPLPHQARSTYGPGERRGTIPRRTGRLRSRPGKSVVGCAIHPVRGGGAGGTAGGGQLGATMAAGGSAAGAGGSAAGADGSGAGGLRGSGAGGLRGSDTGGARERHRRGAGGVRECLQGAWERGAPGVLQGCAGPGLANAATAPQGHSGGSCRCA